MLQVDYNSKAVTNENSFAFRSDYHLPKLHVLPKLKGFMVTNSTCGYGSTPNYHTVQES